MIGIEYTGTVHCSFCGTAGHNITSCPQVAVIAEDAHLKQAAGYPITYRHKQAVYEMRKRQQRKAKKATQSRKKAKCSFCRSENHRRPSCNALKTLRKQVYHANANWKRYFAKTVSEAGVGIGALIMIPTQILDWTAGKDDWSTCMILEYDLDTINVFSSYQGRDNFRTTATMRLVTVDGTQREFNWPFDRIAPFHNRGLSSRGYNYGITKVLSKCEWQPPSDWLDRKCPEIEYVLKKITFDNPTIKKNIETMLTKWE